VTPTIETIAGWLGAPSETITAFADGEKYLGISWKSEVGTYRLVIRIMAEPDRIIFVVPGIMQMPSPTTPPDRLVTILTLLAEASYSDPLCAWGYDPSDGEVRLTLAQLLINGELEEGTFRALLNHAMRSVEAMIVKLAAA